MPVVLTLNPFTHDYEDLSLHMRLPVWTLAERVSEILDGHPGYYASDYDEAVDTVLSEVTIDDLVAIR